MDDVAGTTGYEYDEVGRITAVNLSNGKKIKYSYDEYGNISKLTYPDNTTVQYTYNALDQITQIKDRQGKITKYDRDANGNITKVTRPNNTYSTIEYDDMGNVIKVVNMGKNPYYNIEEELSTFAYTYDKSGFITGEAAKNGRRIEASQYEYDERGQLVKVSQTVTENNQFVEETEMVYTYDGAGNRLSAVKTSSGKILCNIQYTYNDNSQITDIESDCDDDKQTHIVLTYDENGNLKNTTCNDTEKVRDYTYDNENRLKAVKENGSLLMAALYDGNGDRIFRLDYRKNDEYVSNKAGTAENVYYPSGSVNSAYDTDVILNEMLIPNGVTNNTAINYELTGYINDINTEYTQTLMEFGANGNTTNIYEYGAQRNSATINGTKGYYLYDGRGSVAGLTGNTGGSMITYRYDAYGNTTKSNNTLNNPYQYNAEYTDSSTGLQYLRARYYDSSQGRFTAKDTLLGSIEKPITRNLYTYCGNNPLNITDPSGHSWISRAWNGVKSAAKTAGNWANKHIVQPVKKAANTAVNWANTHVVQPIKNRITNSAAYQKGKQYVEQAKQTYNTVTNYVSNKAQQFYNDYVPPKMQKAIEEAKKFVCTTTDRIVKDAKEFIQNVDWKKVAIGVAATAAITLAVVATGGAAAPVLIGAAVGAGISTGTTVVSGVIQGKSPAEIAKDASGAFMWGAIGGAVGGGTTQLLGKVGTKVIGKVGKKVIEDGVDMALDLAQTASENGGLTGKDILFSATTTLSGGLLSSVKTPSTVRNQLVDGVADNKAVKNAVTDSVTDNKAVKNAVRDNPYAVGDATFMKADDAFSKNIAKRADVDANGYYDVVAHGTPNGIQITHNGKEMIVDSRTAAKLIQNSDGYNGQNIRLLSCNTGSLDNGFAQNLSNKLNVEVSAPNNYLWATSNGNYFVAGMTNGSPNYSDMGTFVSFKPGGN